MNEFDEFARYLTEQDKATLTVRGYLADIRIFSRWFRRTNEEDLKADNWVSGDVRAYKEELLNKAAKPQTINRRLAALVSFGNWAVQAGLIESNPALHIRSPSKPEVAGEARESCALASDGERFTGRKKTLSSFMGLASARCGDYDSFAEYRFAGGRIMRSTAL